LRTDAKALGPIIAGTNAVAVLPFAAPSKYPTVLLAPGRFGVDDPCEAQGPIS
jgi:hypothetical protein